MASYLAIQLVMTVSLLSPSMSGNVRIRWKITSAHHISSMPKVKGTVLRDFLLLVFFMNQCPPHPRLHFSRVEFFRKFTKIFASQGARPVSTTPVANLPPVSTTPAEKLPPVSTTPVANLAPVSATPAANSYTIFASVVDTGGKFATGVNDTGGKFATGVNDAGGKLPAVSTTPAANLPLVSTTPVANNDNKIRLQTPWSELAGKNLYICLLYQPKASKQNDYNFSAWRFFPFATGVNDTSGKPWAANISANFRKNSKRPQWYNQRLGGNWFKKKTRSKKSRDTVPLRSAEKYHQVNTVFSFRPFSV